MIKYTSLTVSYNRNSTTQW